MSDPTLKLFREARANAGTGASPLDVAPEAVRLWRRARELQAVGRVNPRVPASWSDEYRAVRSALRRVLHRKAWQAHPLDVDDGRDPPNPQWDAAGAAELRRQLEEASA